MVNPVNNSGTNYFKLIAVMLLFLLLAFDRDLAVIYLLIMLADWVWFLSDNFISFPMSSNRISNLQVLVETALALGGFLLIAGLLVSFFSPQSIATGVVEGAQSIFHLLAASTPILKGSLVLTFIGWAIVVPIIETNFFAGRLLEGLSTYAEKIIGKRISLDKFSMELFVVMLIVSSLFTLFHITAKGLESIPLLITFLFMMISCVLVVRHKSTKGAIWLHIAVNSAAVLSTMGVL